MNAIFDMHMNGFLVMSDQPHQGGSLFMQAKLLWYEFQLSLNEIFPLLTVMKTE